MCERRIPVLALAALLLIGCGGSGGQSESVTVRLGYFPNVTHGTAIVGVAEGILAQRLGPDVTLEPHTFNAGPEAIEALISGAVDATFIGPNPAINAFIKSNGQAIRIVSGATSGGAFLVVREGINSAADLRGKQLATPQLGNTQDVALRAWLGTQGYATDTLGGGDVSITSPGNSASLEAFRAGQIDGAWVPEPWATLMVRAGGRVLVDERDLWPQGSYVTTHLIVSTTFLRAHRAVVKRLIEGVVAANDYVNGNAAAARVTVAGEITRITGSAMAPDVLATAWANLTFTVDPIVSSLQRSADEARELGFLQTSDLTGIYDLTLLNEVLTAAGRPAIGTP